MILGAGTHSFLLSVSEKGEDSVYVYADYVKAVGLVTDFIPHDEIDADIAYTYITPGRTIDPATGQSFVLMNEDGLLCVVRLRSVTCERNDKVYEKPRIVFDYKILLEK